MCLFSKRMFSNPPAYFKKYAPSGNSQKKELCELTSANKFNNFMSTSEFPEIVMLIKLAANSQNIAYSSTIWATT